MTRGNKGPPTIKIPRPPPQNSPSHMAPCTHLDGLQRLAVVRPHRPISTASRKCTGPIPGTLKSPACTITGSRPPGSCPGLQSILRGKSSNKATFLLPLLALPSGQPIKALCPSRGLPKTTADGEIKNRRKKTTTFCPTLHPSRREIGFKNGAPI